MARAAFGGLHRHLLGSEVSHELTATPTIRRFLAQIAFHAKRVREPVRAPDWFACVRAWAPVPTQAHRGGGRRERSARTLVVGPVVTAVPSRASTATKDVCSVTML